MNVIASSCPLGDIADQPRRVGCLTKGFNLWLEFAGLGPPGVVGSSDDEMRESLEEHVDSSSEDSEAEHADSSALNALIQCVEGLL